MIPAQWTPRLVQQRLREAFAVERQPPATRSPLAVERANEALSWLVLVDDVAERRYLAAQALAADRGLSIRAMLRCRRWSHSTFYRSVGAAASQIAASLSERGVAVR
jgi:hypothetical protein